MIIVYIIVRSCPWIENVLCTIERGIVDDLRRTKSECFEESFSLSFGHYSHRRFGSGIYGAFVGNPSIQFKISSKHPYFAVINGALYSKANKELLAYTHMDETYSEYKSGILFRTLESRKD